MARPVVTLTTDFGVTDPYVAAMKGVLRTRCPDLAIDDLSHTIPPQDVAAASRFLAGALPYYPKGCIHLAVVDPGVGGPRHPVAVQAAGHILVGPDNGIFTQILQTWPLEAIRRIENPALAGAQVSKTFHGRDIFAPAAGALAAGFAWAELGAPLTRLVELPLPPPCQRDGRTLRGQILTFDHFGNALTNLPAPLLPASTSCVVQLAAHTLHGIHETYAAVPPGALLALVGSSGHLEIAVRNGSARAVLGLALGEEVRVIAGETPPDLRDMQPEAYGS